MEFRWPEPLELGGEILQTMTDDEFLKFCRDNSLLRFERFADGKILIFPPQGAESSVRNGKLSFQLFRWTEGEGHGISFGFGAGFKLRDQTIRAANMAWMEKENWESISENLKTGFAPLCPRFILELRSPSDSLKYLQSKMLEWIKNGVRLGFLIDPLEKISFVYRADGSVDRWEGFERELSGEDVLPGFKLDLRVLLK